MSDKSAERMTPGRRWGVTGRGGAALSVVTAVAGKTPEPPPRP
ncbi:hypothetical protein SBD_7091 [Streptomyces bottropensis ATCC 25435]|uniref:Uncharacterized protein n=1 Tax=Streptomyces bottropensis ATCC 25435 TaxID=1054862 RepID=M3FEU3_9ACTN|nr:hypothetical protein SBD_7091 [Streptomyces bottropensis ATCC 25435]